MKLTILRIHKAFLATLAASLVVVFMPTSFAAASDYVTQARKLHCSTKDNKPIVYFWSGDAFARVPGERDKLLFKLNGMNVRQCAAVKDKKKGRGYKLVSRELMLYLDPKTGQILREWKNPWSGKTVKVLHVANDPVNHTNYEIGRDGTPAKLSLKRLGKQRFAAQYTIPLFYTNPLGGDYQKYVGGMYHSAEMFGFFGDYRQLTKSKLDTIPIDVSWTRISDWLPWMEMSGRAGSMYFHALGYKLARWNDLPKVMKREIRKNHPVYVKPPPASDTRPNETSWSYFKKLFDERDLAK